jgi:magnesium-transporting ATPase (P-type)
LLILLEFLALQLIRKRYGVPLWSNRWLLIAIVVSLGLTLMLVYVPFFAMLFQTAPLSLQVWGEMGVIVAGVAVVAWGWSLVEKLIFKNQL